MGDILSIISKAQFEAEHRAAKVGDVLGYTKYVSTHAALEPVRGGGSIFLVTVRPPDERLWLLAELVDPKHDDKAWVSKPSSLAVRDITELISVLKFNGGKGITAKKGALGMSLQTPRLLTEADVLMLRGGKRAASPQSPPKPAKPGATAQTTTPRKAAVAAGLSLSEVLAEWRVTRAPELERLIETLSEHHARAWPALDPEADDYDNAWNARIAEATPESLAHLLPGLWSDPKGSIPIRLRKLLDLGADPRLGAAMLEMISEPPVTASSNFAMWTLLFKSLPTMVDSRAAKTLQTRMKAKGGDSQFWPKLNGWIESVLEVLPEPSTLSKEQLASVKLRQQEAEELRKGSPPSATAKPAKASGAAPMKGSPREALEEAVALFTAGKHLEVLEPLRQYWVVTRDPGAGALLGRLGKAFSEAQERFDEGKAAEIHTGWMKAGKTFDTRLVTPLIDAVKAGTLADAEERLDAMLTWAPDARVAQKMIDLIDSYIGARPQFFKRVYDLLVLNADPRFLEQLQKNADRLERAPAYDRNRIERPHASRTIVAYVDAASKGRKPTADEARLLENLSELVDGLKQKTKRAAKPDQEIELLKAIVEAPSDETPKLVYADFLTERGDVRGEFINLSLALERGEKVKSKLEAFEKKHRRKIAGAFEDYRATDLSSGLFASFGVDLYAYEKFKLSDYEELVEDLRWVTVSTVHLPEVDEVASLILARAPLYGAEVLNRAPTRALEAASVRDFPWRVHTIRLNDFRLGSKVKASAFPKLKTLNLPMAWSGPPDPAFWDAPLLHQAAIISIGNVGTYGDVFIDELIAHAPSLAKLERIEATISYLRMEVVPAGAGRCELSITFTSAYPEKESFEKILERLKRIPAKAVRSLKLLDVATLAPAFTKLVEQATAHLTV